MREAAWVGGLSPWRTFTKIELPLAWPGVLAGVAMTAAHTLGEFGVVLMVGGAIPGETKTLSVAIYDRVQAFDDAVRTTWRWHWWPAPWPRWWRCLPATAVHAHTRPAVMHDHGDLTWL